MNPFQRFLIHNEATYTPPPYTPPKMAQVQHDTLGLRQRRLHSLGCGAPVRLAQIHPDAARNRVNTRNAIVLLETHQTTLASSIVETVTLTPSTRLLLGTRLSKGAHQGNRLRRVPCTNGTPIRQGKVVSYTSRNRILTDNSKILVKTNQAVRTITVVATVTLATTADLGWSAIPSKWL